MYSLATRSALRRAVAAPVSHSAAVAQRYSSTMHENDPEVLEVEKQRNLSKKQHHTSTPIKNAPGWNHYLASASEAAVKADRSDHNLHELQEETLHHIKQRHGHGESTVAEPSDVPPKSGNNKGAVSGEERVDAYEATYERDEMTGPLKHSAKMEGTERDVYKQRVDRKESDLPGGM
ncbi:uncharacterized protein PHACADRAFT_252678 [Phanerochaete carnosa HHB-10118-sp]|uniref:Uncharacterized protein n=1 Tax=Phanerochaete carnosa (strain HHB-10118-sp) TaxID=650164 RepID=K5W3F9_PHACS|nr:uncharacterized protein PHACADRAFT_252678 [Phanerochaete carnosa HHB-10118-sp]EKM58393.1 hypothetical protein PHACADRAFT_252678 [Phanerochaete carnosa HHB-10118-sp]